MNSGITLFEQLQQSCSVIFGSNFLFCSQFDISLTYSALQTGEMEITKKTVVLEMAEGKSSQYYKIPRMFHGFF